MAPKLESQGSQSPPPPENAKTQEPPDLTTTEKLERYMQGFITAINKRDFDLNSPAWSHADVSFQGEAERPPGDSDLAAPGMSSLEENMAMFKFMAASYPEYHIKIFDLSTEINEKKDKATMFWNGETTGLPGGVILPSVGMCEFRLFSGGHWRCTSFRGARGPGDGIPDAAVGGV